LTTPRDPADTFITLPPGGRPGQVNPLRPPDVPSGGTPHLTIGNVRQELTPPPVRITTGLERTHDPHGRRLTAEELETRRSLVRVIAADPVKIQWLRDYGATLLRSAAAELLMTTAGPSVKVVETRAAEHERGETALW